jgi:hypothetical protein
MKEERDPLKKGHGLLGEGVLSVSRCRWISARKTEGHDVQLACRALRVSPSSYYEWRAKHANGPSAGDLDEAYLVNEINAIHDHFDDSFGSPRLNKELATRGYCTNHKRVERLVATTASTPPTLGARRFARPLPTCGRQRCLTACNGTSASGPPGRRRCRDITRGSDGRCGGSATGRDT